MVRTYWARRLLVHRARANLVLWVPPENREHRIYPNAEYPTGSRHSKRYELVDVVYFEIP